MRKFLPKFEANLHFWSFDVNVIRNQFSAILDKLSSRLYLKSAVWLKQNTPLAKNIKNVSV